MGTTGEEASSSSSRNHQPQTGIRSLTHRGFTISARNMAILKAGPIEAMAGSLGITPPEMIFGDNYVRIEQAATGWAIFFCAYDALDRVDKTGADMLQVAYSKQWQDHRAHVHAGQIRHVVRPFDWSYTTDYTGTIPPALAAAADSDPLVFVASEIELPLELLRRRDPLLFSGTTDLFEDELADNGMSVYTVKYRVMPDRLLLLARFFLRLDDVIFRIRDTRIVIEFATGEVLREYVEREEKYSIVKDRLGQREDVASIMRQPELLTDLCPIVKLSRDRLVLPVCQEFSAR